MNIILNKKINFIINNTKAKLKITNSIEKLKKEKEELTTQIAILNETIDNKNLEEETLNNSILEKDAIIKNLEESQNIADPTELEIILEKLNTLNNY